MKLFNILPSSVLLAILCWLPASGYSETEVVMLGTGTPQPDAHRAGAGTAIIYNNEAYLFDAGSGVLRRAIEAWEKYDLEALYPLNIKHLFFTHLHNDHTIDYVEFAGTYWWRRKEPLNVWGPKGIKQTTFGMYSHMAKDIEIRSAGYQPVINGDGYQANVTTIEPGVLLDDGKIKIEAFDVPHGEIKPAYGFRITTPDKTIVISGDTGYSEKMKDVAKGADILIHETISSVGLNEQTPFWQQYHSSSHTPTDDLARIATEAKPKLLVLYHVLLMGQKEQAVLKEVTSQYSGKVVFADDLDRY